MVATKPVSKRPRITLTFNQVTIREVDEKRGLIPRSAFIDAVLRKAFEQKLDMEVTSWKQL